ncbi:MAG: formylglycine-generating enzyme family protein [Chitinispirillaceae bacterium]
MLLLFIALSLCTLFFFLQQQKEPDSATASDPEFPPSDTVSDTASVSDSVMVEDTVSNDDSVKVPRPDPPSIPKKVQKEVKKDSTDTAAAAAQKDSLVEDTAVLLDSVVVLDSVVPPDPCLRDTAAPRVYPEPSGGLHRKVISVKLMADKSCTIRWKTEENGEWKIYASPIQLKENTVLYYSAADSCGNEMKTRRELYDFDLSGRAGLCPDDMEYVRVGKSEFCMDKYEWPNRKGAAPLSFVSLYEAMDSCFSAGKRLCTSEEWTTACAGPRNWKYSYGKRYEKEACTAQDSMASSSGSNSECRGYFGIYDMSGNLAEWTSTKSKTNRSFNNVMGGFWESGTQSKCGDKRYSYYPQNRHNPVGFRCCKDIPESDKNTSDNGSGR